MSSVAMSNEFEPFAIVEATIEDIHGAFKAGRLTARQLVEQYLARIELYDQKGPAINAIISLNQEALSEADRLDAALKSGSLTGPLHGIPFLIKDQVDVDGMKTTLGSVLFENYQPQRDSFVIKKIKEAGAIILGKVTLGELGGGDTHGSLFGSTKNVYDLERTAGGSSGGSGAAVSANFCAASIGQEGFASIRRPSIWNGIVGMRPSAGLVSRTGAFGGWPALNGSLGPMARTVTDLARILDCMVGYDPADPATAYGFDKKPASYSANLSKTALTGARIGILREPMGFGVAPDSEDFKKVDAVFSAAVDDLRKAGAEIVDPVVIPDLNALLKTRARSSKDDDAGYEHYIKGTNAPFPTRAAAQASPLFEKVGHHSKDRWRGESTAEQQLAQSKARTTLMTNLMNVMAEHRLDAIVHKAVEQQPTLIKDGISPPFVDQRGAPFINTFLMFVPSIVVPAGFTTDNLPAGITFLGRPYSDARMIELAYAYEQATHHRRAPASTP
jgi:amidase